MTKKQKTMGPVHPGEILREDFMVDYGLKPTKVAQLTGVPRSRIEAIIRCERSITADTAIRLGRVFKWPAKMWLDIQAQYDTQMALAEKSSEYDKLEKYEASV